MIRLSPNSEAVSIAIWALKQFFKLDRLATSAKIITGILIELNSVINNLIMGLTIDFFARSIQVQKFSTNEFIGIILIYLIYFIVISGGTRLINQYASSYLRRILRFAPRLMIAEKLNYLGIEFLEKSNSNNLITRSRENFNKMEISLEVSSVFIGLVVTLIASGIILLKFSPILTITIILISIPRFIINSRYIRKDWDIEKNTTIENRISDGNLGYLITSSTLKEVLSLEAFGFLSTFFRNFSKKLVDLSKSNRRSWYLRIWLLRLLEIPIFIFAFILLIDNLISGVVTIGAVTVILNNIWIFSGSIGGLTGTYTDLTEATIRLKEFKELLEKEKDFPDGKNTISLKDAPSIEFKNIDFAYGNSTRKIFKNFNLNIKPGEKIAIVGHNGAGKTTLIKLLTRIYTLPKGEILINGENINTLTRESLNNEIGVLFQDYNTYEHLSVRDNILIGNIYKRSDDKEVWKALKMADASEFVKEYPNGLDTILSEKYENGIRPSTGQSQKIAIARFFYRNAPILVLDEPTASIDAVAEANIFNKIYKFIENKTVIIISHRFSTVRNADRIIVLEHGNIIEQGTHSELLRLGGTYAQAFNLQAKGYSQIDSNSD